MRHTKQNAPRRTKRRAIPFIFGNNRREELFFRLLADPDPRLRVYVYPFANGRRTGSALFIGLPFETLLDHLRDEWGSGEYQVMIRRDKRMEISGLIAIEAPLGWTRKT